MPLLSLLSRFALVSLVLVVGLGAVMAQQLASMISQRALRSATDAAVLTTTIAIQPLLTARDLAEGIFVGQGCRPRPGRGRLPGRHRDRAHQHLGPRR